MESGGAEHGLVDAAPLSRQSRRNFRFFSRDRACSTRLAPGGGRHPPLLAVGRGWKGVDPALCILLACSGDSVHS